MRDRWHPGDRVYVYYGATPAFLYYTRDDGFSADAVTFGEVLGTGPPIAGAEFEVWHEAQTIAADAGDGGLMMVGCANPAAGEGDDGVGHCTDLDI